MVSQRSPNKHAINSTPTSFFQGTFKDGLVPPPHRQFVKPINLSFQDIEKVQNDLRGISSEKDLNTYKQQNKLQLRDLSQTKTKRWEANPKIKTVKLKTTLAERKLQQKLQRERELEKLDQICALESQARKDATLKATKQHTVESSATVRAWKSKFLALDCLEDRARSIEQKRSESEKIQRKEEDEYINHFTRENLEKEKAEKLKIENARNVNMQIALELKEQIGNKIEKEKEERKYEASFIPTPYHQAQEDNLIKKAKEELKSKIKRDLNETYQEQIKHKQAEKEAELQVEKLAIEWSSKKITQQKMKAMVEEQRKQEAIQKKAHLAELCYSQQIDRGKVTDAKIQKAYDKRIADELEREWNEKNKKKDEQRMLREAYILSEKQKQQQTQEAKELAAKELGICQSIQAKSEQEKIEKKNEIFIKNKKLQEYHLSQINQRKKERNNELLQSKAPIKGYTTMTCNNIDEESEALKEFANQFIDLPWVQQNGRLKSFVENTLMGV